MQSFVIDQKATFGEKAKLTKVSVEPKLKYGSETGEQAETKQGVPKYAVQVLVQYTNQFGNMAAEVIKLTVASESDPNKSIPDMSQVELVDLTVGLMDRDDGGMNTFFQAAGMRPASQAAPAAPAAPVSDPKSGKAAA